MNTAPVTTVPVTTAPVTTVPVNTAPVTTVPVNTAPVTTVPVTTAPVTTVPVTTAPVTLQIISDFHLEHRDGEKVNYEDFIVPSADVLALLGDIGSPYGSSLGDFLGWCAERFKQVLYIPGNHEYYSPYGDPVGVLHEQLRKLCMRYKNVMLLDNKTFVMNDVMFVGSTLWSDIPIEKEDYVRNYMNDFRMISASQGVILTPAHLRVEFDKNKAFIQEKVVEGKRMGKKVVVLTHHAPSLIGTSAPQYDTSDSRFAFASTLSCTHDPTAIRLWCCGHTHYNFHHNHEGYELRSNQVGYKTPINGYVKDLCIVL